MHIRCLRRLLILRTWRECRPCGHELRDIRTYIARRERSEETREGHAKRTEESRKKNSTKKKARKTEKYALLVHTIPQQVVQVLLRRCTHQPKAKPTDWNAPRKGAKTSGSIPSPPKSPEEVRLPEGQRNEGVTDGNAILSPAGDGHRRRTIVPLSRLILRGNCLTDAGAVALAPLVRASHSLMEVDLKGNSIGKKGKLALKKVVDRCLR